MTGGGRENSDEIFCSDEWRKYLGNRGWKKENTKNLARRRILLAACVFPNDKQHTRGFFSLRKMNDGPRSIYISFPLLVRESEARTEILIFFLLRTWRNTVSAQVSLFLLLREGEKGEEKRTTNRVKSRIPNPPFPFLSLSVTPIPNLPPPFPFPPFVF